MYRARVQSDGWIKRYESIRDAIDELASEMQIVLAEAGIDGTVVSMGPMKELVLRSYTKPSKTDKLMLKDMGVKW